MKKQDKPKGAYIGRADCGCVLAVGSDEHGKYTAQWVKEMIESGLTIDHVTWDEYTGKICKEPGFMDCPHEKKPADSEQPALFEVE